MSDRQTVAQRGPAVPLESFPLAVLPAGAEVHRAHSSSLGPWWFGSDGGGRFDLTAPRGTCYTAADPATALRERIGPVLGGATSLPETLLADVVVSRLRLGTSWRLADLQHRRAGGFGVTRELESMVPYAVPQAWAAAFAVAGWDGVTYGPRFTPGDAAAYALFGEAGSRDWPTDPDPVPARLVPGAPGLLPTPRRADLNVVRPPRTRVPRAQPGSSAPSGNGSAGLTDRPG